MRSKEKAIVQLTTEQHIKELYKELKRLREELQELQMERELDRYLALEYT